MKKIIFCILIFSLLTQLCFSQKTISRKIDDFFIDFQKNADTTFIIKRTSGYPTANYYILSKKDRQINIYFYGDATRSILIPPGIKSIMKKLNFGSEKIKAYKNSLFYPLTITKTDGIDFWHKVIQSKPWQINDAEKNQYCADLSVKLYDGDVITLFLITEKEIKSLVFPSPDFYEEKCPGNEHRKSILNIQDVFKSNFNF